MEVAYNHRGKENNGKPSKNQDEDKEGTTKEEGKKNIIDLKGGELSIREDGGKAKEKGKSIFITSFLELVSPYFKYEPPPPLSDWIK